jgi:UDP-N-acetylmuramoyl-L-alanyl-D-glutamate--2,6-diaminopimelate ligase
VIAAPASRSVRLSALLAGFSPPWTGADPTVAGLALDSRAIQAGDCFIALQGSQRHGIAHLADALQRGAVAVVTDQVAGSNQDPSVPVVSIPALSSTIGEIAARFFDHPSERLRVIAVTGTNGKTTVANLCAQALSSAGHACGYVGTLGAGPLGSLVALGLTTPDAITLQRELRKLVDADFQAVALEASSHALAQSRLVGTSIDIAAFNGSLAAYAEAKKKLFAHAGLRHAVLNMDDDLGRRIYAELSPDIVPWHCSLLGSPPPSGSTHYAYATAIKYTATGTRIEIKTHLGGTAVESCLVGDFNAQNLLQVLAILLALDFPLAQAAGALSHVRPVVGRLESMVSGSHHPQIYVDYAHSPDSLERVLKVLRSFATGALICVFGCGGNRDRSKRPMMGAIAERYCDRVYLTADNPRDEHPGAITAEILTGFSAPEKAFLIEDRVVAIHAALDAAAPNDIVLIAGKGHETGQVIGAELVPMSDQMIVRDWLASQA